MFRQLADVYGFPPQVVREWTYYQCRMMSCEEEQLTGVRRVSEAAGKAALGKPRPRKKMLQVFRHTGLMRW
jgi:hypothetical protein